MKPAARLRKRFRQSHRHSDKTPAYEPMTKDGKRMAILRPLDPTLALTMVNAIPDGTPHEEAERLFNEILEAQPYRFVGIAAKATGDGPPAILHPVTLKPIGRVQAGDSFVDHDEMQRYGQRIPDPE